MIEIPTYQCSTRTICIHYMYNVRNFSWYVGTLGCCYVTKTHTSSYFNTKLQMWLFLINNRLIKFSFILISIYIESQLLFNPTMIFSSFSRLFQRMISMFIVAITQFNATPY